MRSNGGGSRGPTLDIRGGCGSLAAVCMSEGRLNFKLARKQRGKVYHLKSTDVSEVEILSGRRQEIIGHILERGHSGENL